MFVPSTGTMEYHMYMWYIRPGFLGRVHGTRTFASRLPVIMRFNCVPVTDVSQEWRGLSLCTVRDWIVAIGFKGHACGYFV